MQNIIMLKLMLMLIEQYCDSCSMEVTKYCFANEIGNLTDLNTGNTRKLFCTLPPHISRKQLKHEYNLVVRIMKGVIFLDTDLDKV